MAFKLDFFRKIPEELQIGNTSSSLFSLLSLVFMLLLCVNHFQEYRQSSVRYQIGLDGHQEDQLRINFNVSLLAVPCRYASVDLSDQMGQKMFNLTRHIRHFRLASGVKTSSIRRLEEVVIAQDTNLPVWGGVTRASHEGIHYSMPLNTRNFVEFMSKYELVLVNYYAPWCPYCQQLAPEWEKAAAQLKDHPEFSETVTMASVDCTDPDAVWLCRRAHIRAFPSMLIYMYGHTFTHFIYSGPRTAEHLLQFLDLFYRRLDPDADFAEEVQNALNDAQGDGQFVPQHIEQGDLDQLDLSRKSNQQQPNTPSHSFGADSIEGCEISGSLNVARVPSKIVLTARSTDQSFVMDQVNVSHVVNHFSFGQMKRKEHLMDHRVKRYSDRFPLDNGTFYSETSNITIEHFLNVVGYDHEEKRSAFVALIEREYEFSASTTQYNASNTFPAALFTFDISPLVIRVVSDSVPFYRFLTSLCAVVGGVFTMVGLVDSGVFHAMNSIKKKEMLGKLH